MELRSLPVSCHQMAVLVPWPPVEPERNSGQWGVEVFSPSPPPKVILSHLGLRMSQGKADHRREGTETKSLKCLHGRQVGEPRTRDSHTQQGDEVWILEEPQSLRKKQERKMGTNQHRCQWDQILLVVRGTLRTHLDGRIFVHGGSCLLPPHPKWNVL